MGQRSGLLSCRKNGRFDRLLWDHFHDEQGRVFGKNDPYKQTVFIIGKIEAALKELDASLEDVVRTRIYTTDITRWSEIARAHRRFFGKVTPTCTMVQVSRLIHPEMLVEVEVEAVR